MISIENCVRRHCANDARQQIDVRGQALIPLPKPLFHKDVWRCFAPHVVLKPEIEKRENQKFVIEKIAIEKFEQNFREENLPARSLNTPHSAKKDSGNNTCDWTQ